MTVKKASDLVAAARQQIVNLTPAEVADEVAQRSAVLVDIRESEERQQHGMIPGAIHAPRGMLEFYADPSSPYHRAELNPGNRIVLHCASGGRSALAAQALQAMGFENVAHLDGGLNAWKEAGQAIEQFPQLGMDGPSDRQ